jgi:hypothetical protein
VTTMISSSCGQEEEESRGLGMMIMVKSDPRFQPMDDES